MQRRKFYYWWRRFYYWWRRFFYNASWCWMVRCQVLSQEWNFTCRCMIHWRLRVVFWEKDFIRSCTTPVCFEDMSGWKLLKLIQCQAQKWKLQENKFMLYVSQVPGRVSTSQEDDWYWSFNEWNSSYFQRHGAFLHVNVTMIQSSYNGDAIQLLLKMVRAFRPPAHHPSLCFITS